eukprot:GSChrysophyteH2.ASY1.ANO1.1423.1 assembled CDS
MAPKQPKSKKAIREKSAQALSDATFGLKNKNKSAKVQQFVNQVKVAVKHSDGSAAREGQNMLKKANKLQKAAEQAELNRLLGEGLTGQTNKKMSDLEAKAAALGLTEMSAEVEEMYEVKEKRKTIYLDSDDSDADEGTRVYREKTIEDLIDEQRAKLQSEGKPGTPVNETTFSAWRKKKLEERQKAAEERVRIEQTKKKGGKGLSVLSGRELFKYDASLFKDDDAAINKDQEMELSNALKLSQEAEEVLEKEASEKAQKEQERLMEVQKVEREARKLKDEARRIEAAKKLRLMVVGGVTINEIVFEEDEAEDLTIFEDDDDDDSSESEEETSDGECELESRLE